MSFGKLARGGKERREGGGRKEGRKRGREGGGTETMKITNSK